MSDRKEGFMNRKPVGEAERAACPFVARSTTSFWSIEWNYSGVQDGPEESISFLEQQL